jgi:hypothetical protein
VTKKVNEANYSSFFDKIRKAYFLAWDNFQVSNPVRRLLRLENLRIKPINRKEKPIYKFQYRKYPVPMQSTIG